MIYYNKYQAQVQINNLAKARIPFLSLIDYEMNNIQVYPLNEVPNNIHYNINGVSNSKLECSTPPSSILKKYPIGIKKYEKGFNLVKSELQYGNSFLLNLTYPTQIKINLSFKDIFNYSKAKYKLWIENELVVFSPETFIKISDGKISSYPMKGTINASIENAKEVLINDKKELAEHYTIVDLIRNDLSKVAKNVQVEKFRYLEKIKTSNKELFQVSSKITGILPNDYLDHLGDILFDLLPAGSISGAPKEKTVDIIKQAEKINRGYYTGVLAIFDGAKLDTGIMIRYIEKRDGKKYYRSGGGITHMSNLAEEYQELLDKVYVPIIRDHPNLKRKNPIAGVSQ